MTKLEQILEMMSDLSCKELDEVRQATYQKRSEIEITCPHCSERITPNGTVYSEQCHVGWVPLVVEDDGELFYDWDRSELEVCVDVYCPECEEYIGTRYDIQEIWDRELKKVIASDANPESQNSTEA